MNFQFNKDQTRRDKILGITGERDYECFPPLSVENLGWLIDEKFADPDERQNKSPAIREFYDFMVKHPEYKAIGYAIGLKRNDYRVSIEGLEGKAKNHQSFLEFVQEFHGADEFDVDDNYQRCWYD
jgi:hypothetical protein